MAFDTLTQPKLTIDDYHRLTEQPDHRERIFELIAGELVEKMPSAQPSALALIIAFYLMQLIRPQGLGYVTGSDGGYLMPDGSILIPDVGFISKARLPVLPERGEAPIAPDLAVEVMSPTDRKRDLRSKAVRYLANGVRLVWLVFPAERVIEVYPIDGDVIALTDADTLTGGDVLPDFSVPVSAVFGTAE